MKKIKGIVIVLSAPAFMYGAFVQRSSQLLVQPAAQRVGSRATSRLGSVPARSISSSLGKSTTQAPLRYQTTSLLSSPNQPIVQQRTFLDWLRGSRQTVSPQATPIRKSEVFSDEQLQLREELRKKGAEVDEIQNRIHKLEADKKKLDAELGALGEAEEEPSEVADKIIASVVEGLKEGGKTGALEVSPGVKVSLKDITLEDIQKFKNWNHKNSLMGRILYEQEKIMKELSRLYPLEREKSNEVDNLAREHGWTVFYKNPV